MNEKKYYILQCVNSKSIFQASISEIIFDTDILFCLHPLQSCFIGIEYTRYLKNNPLKFNHFMKNEGSTSRNIKHNYGVLKLRYQDRKGNLCYININTNEEFIMDPKEIAFTDNIITKFHAEQAFYIGICAGLKIHRMPNNVIQLDISNNYQNNAHSV